MCEIGLSAIVTSGLPTDRQTLRDFGRSRLRAPPTRARAGFARARPGVRGKIPSCTQESIRDSQPERGPRDR